MKNKYAFRRAKNRIMNIIWTALGLVVVLWVGGQLLGGCDPWWSTFEETITEDY